MTTIATTRDEGDPALWAIRHIEIELSYMSTIVDSPPEDADFEAASERLHVLEQVLVQLAALPGWDDQGSALLKARDTLSSHRKALGAFIDAELAPGKIADMLQRALSTTSVMLIEVRERREAAASPQ